ncbi:MAG: hypothetical protein E4H08_04580 [Candidatus Atribacteria bacterium]|nr:MAG: hypothetical protein E4H08_04580 [Candidatus Atribacteria bacterium]
MIFLHIGLPKTGTTFLQQTAFACWPNITYENDLWLPYVVLQEEGKKYLISNETLTGRPWNRNSLQNLSWHQEMERILSGLNRLFPEASVMVSFRKHAGFIESLYAQYLHEGGTRRLEDFFTLEGDSSIICAQDLDYSKIVQSIASRFGERVFVFTLEQLRANLDCLLVGMGEFFGESPPDIGGLDLSYRNRGVGHHQAKLLRLLNHLDRKPGTHLKPCGRMTLTNTWTRALRIDPRSLCQDRLAWISSRKLKLPDVLRVEVDRYFAEDWRHIEELASKHLL